MKSLKELFIYGKKGVKIFTQSTDLDEIPELNQMSIQYLCLLLLYLTYNGVGFRLGCYSVQYTSLKLLSRYEPLYK